MNLKYQPGIVADAATQREIENNLLTRHTRLLNDGDQLLQLMERSRIKLIAR